MTSRRFTAAAGITGWLAAAGAAWADTVSLPAVLERGAHVAAVWRVDPPAAEAGRLVLRWTDSAGRLVEQHALAVPAGAAIVPVPLDTRRALVRGNRLEGRLDLPGGARDAAIGFTVQPPVAGGGAGWTDFQVIMWQDGPPARETELRRLGFTGAKILADRDGNAAAATAKRIETLVGADLGWFVENIATDVYAPYHRWRPGKPVTWLFDETRRLHAADPADPAAYMRQPSLSEMEWRDRIARRLAEHVQTHRAHRPLFYNLADEPGIADLAAFWDFDLSPPSLAGFRDWLRREYASLDALNRQWGTGYAAWADVMPMLTGAALRQRVDNFSQWSDFKAWMDVAFADAVRAGTEAVHAADPAALAAIEGTQVPGWGGYDYTLLASAVDVMESYNGGNSIEIARSINPALLILTTAFGQGPTHHRSAWRHLLLGSRGLVVWDDAKSVVADDGSLGPGGRDWAPLVAELRGGLAAQVMAAAAPEDKVAILVSPPSFRVNWLLERRADGVPWYKRDSETEWVSPTADRRALGQAVAQLTALGVRPRFVAPAMLAQGALAGAGTRVLVLPRSIALSDQESDAIRRFVEAGGIVLADGPAGLFDGHGRRRTAPAVDGVPLRMPPALATGTTPTADSLVDLATLLRAAGVAPQAAVTDAAGRPVPGLEVRHWQTGDVRLLAVMAEEAGALPPLFLSLPAPAWVADLRRGTPAVHTDRLPLQLPADGPVLLAVSSDPPPPPSVAGPAETVAGTLVPFRLAAGRAQDGATRVLHVEVFDATGMRRHRLSDNIALPAGDTPWLLRLARDDAPGLWRIRVTDRLGGGTAEAVLHVQPVP